MRVGDAMRAALLFVFLAGCATCQPDPTSSRWETIEPDGGVTVADAARAARARGLVPVVYFGASYTLSGSRLVAMRDTPPMRAAFAGFYVIEVDDLDASPSGYHHSFRGLDASGRPTAAALDPGTKDGPCADGDAEACAAWVGPFLKTLR